ncbi:MAG: oligoendopeptidase F, partial [Lachnospiraceae bacterium]|nr:oligoendopeptidase F [Lachnospiraceae bacterium]
MSEEKKLRERSEIEEKYKWRLEDLFATDEDWEKELKKIDEYVEKISSFKGKIAEGPENLLAYLKLNDEIDEWAEEVANYSSRKNDQDTRVGKYQDYHARTMGAFVKLGSASAFFEPELFSLSDEKIEEYFKKVPELEHYRRAYERIRKNKEHVLSNEMEELLAAAGDVTSQAYNTFGMLDNADLKFDSVKDSKGVERSLSHGTFVPLMHEEDRELRKAAFESYYKT